MIYKNWSNDARLNCNNIVQGFAKGFFEVKNFYQMIMNQFLKRLGFMKMNDK